MARNLRDQHGYAMVALLVAMGVMAVMMTAMMPAWKHLVQRDREEEMIFRAKQYVLAIDRYQRKAGPGVLPPNLDVLVEQRFLRKKYTDPLTGGEFETLYATPPAPNGVGQTPTPGTPGGRGGIIGVASKSKEKAIRVINGRAQYNEIQFVSVARSPSPGRPGDTVNPGQANPPRGGNPDGSQSPDRSFGAGGPGSRGGSRSNGGNGPSPAGPGAPPFGSGSSPVPQGPAGGQPPAPRD
jgi:type II secretory pathway pseudopilin PulG